MTTQDIRNSVRYSNAEEVRSSDKVVVGYVFEENGRYRKYYLVNNIDNISRFVCSSSKDKLVCNVYDEALFNTMGQYIDLCIRDSTFLNALKLTLRKYQGKKVYPSFEEAKDDEPALMEC